MIFYLVGSLCLGSCRSLFSPLYCFNILYTWRPACFWWFSWGLCLVAPQYRSGWQSEHSTFLFYCSTFFAYFVSKFIATTIELLSIFFFSLFFPLVSRCLNVVVLWSLQSLCSGLRHINFVCFSLFIQWIFASLFSWKLPLREK